MKGVGRSNPPFPFFMRHDLAWGVGPSNPLTMRYVQWADLDRLDVAAGRFDLGFQINERFILERRWVAIGPSRDPDGHRIHFADRQRAFEAGQTFPKTLRFLYR